MPRFRPVNEKVNLNDVVYTPVSIAKKIYDYFKPEGTILEPCRGGGAFYDLFKEPKDWCEIREGKDFMQYDKHVDWIITNPPFSTYEMFYKKALEIADNIVFLIPLNKTFRNMAEIKMLENWGGLHTVLIIGPGSRINFNMGFICGCIYLKKGYKGLCKIDRIELNDTIKMFEE